MLEQEKTMETAALQPLPPDVIDEPETFTFRPASEQINIQSDPPTTPTMPPDQEDN